MTPNTPTPSERALLAALTFIRDSTFRDAASLRAYADKTINEHRAGDYTTESRPDAAPEAEAVPDAEVTVEAVVDQLVRALPSDWYEVTIARISGAVTGTVTRRELAEDAARLDYIERTFSGMTNRERYLPVQMIWGKGCNGRTLREACDKYMERDAARGALPGVGA